MNEEDFNNTMRAVYGHASSYNADGDIIVQPYDLTSAVKSYTINTQDAAESIKNSKKQFIEQVVEQVRDEFRKDIKMLSFKEAQCDSCFETSSCLNLDNNKICKKCIFEFIKFIKEFGKEFIDRQRQDLANNAFDLLRKKISK